MGVTRAFGDRAPEPLYRRVLHEADDVSDGLTGGEPGRDVRRAHELTAGLDRDIRPAGGVSPGHGRAGQQLTGQPPYDVDGHVYSVAVSGPVDGTTEGGATPEPPVLEVTDSREAVVGDLRVRRALPRRGRRTVGAWCFADHMGPADVSGPAIGPHPHTGLHTVTWLVEGEALHRDSLGSEQVVRPGQLNLMTAGNGVAHAEEAVPGSAASRLHGVQLWVAQPAETRGGEAAFEHHATLPVAEVPGGVATVLVGSLLGATSPARADTPLLGADLVLEGLSTWPLDPSYEHALVVLDGAVGVDGQVVTPGQLAYLGLGRDEVALDGPARVLLLGGTPFGEEVVMWWNFVARSRDEVTEAWRSWTAADDRFGLVTSELPRIPVGPPPWLAAPPN